MATISAKEYWDSSYCDQLKEEEKEEKEEEEEEALSLCDLPVNFIKEERPSRTQDGQGQCIQTDEEFNFLSWGGAQLRETEMCAADEVFFQGQILPLRSSVSSDSGLLIFKHRNISRQLSWYGSRSESMDRVTSSSRSNSTGSQNSSSGTNSTPTTSPTTRNSNPRIHNHFHTFPSPKPQLRISSLRQASFGSHGRKSSAWDFFRLGVVPAPEIELQDLKFRSSNKGSSNGNSVSRNSSSNSSSNGNFKAKSSKNGAENNDNGNLHRGNKSNHGLKQLLGKSGEFLGACKCSIETVPSNIAIIKNNGKGINFCESSSARAMKEKGVEMELKRQRQRQKQAKQAVSRRRTFEWVKELSHASYPDDEALPIMHS